MAGKVEKPNPVTRNDCKVCGGIHFGSGSLCPYRCDECGHQVGPCDRSNCARDARWASEKAESEKWTQAGTYKSPISESPHGR